MLGQLTGYFLLLLVFLFPASGHAQTDLNAVKRSLNEANTLRDSIKLMYGIYEASPASLKGKAMDEMYDFAIARSEFHVANDILRLGSKQFETNDSMLAKYISRAEKLPDSKEKQGTLAILNIVAGSNKMKALEKSRREAALRDYMSRYAESKEYEPYKRLEFLFLLCKYLRTSTGGELLTTYLQELQTLVDNLPADELALKYLFYSQAANIYLSNDNISNGVEANKKLLDIIDSLKKKCEANGYSFHEYDATAFECYLRLLRCHNVLEPDEVEAYYSKIMPLIEGNPEFMRLSSQGKKPMIYLLMSKNQYRQAIPLIKEQLDNKDNTEVERLYLVSALVKAAEAVGDKETLQSALELSNEMFRERIENKAAESYRDLQMIYEVNELKKANDELKLANTQMEVARNNERMKYAVIILVVLVTLLLIVFVMYRRSKKLTSSLSKSNAMISDERDAIQIAKKDLIEASSKAGLANRVKADFISSMVYEIRTPLDFIVEYSELIANCTEKERREYIKKFADVISLNSEILISLVNNVLDLPSLDRGKANGRIVRTSVQEICHTVIEGVAGEINPGVELVFSNEGQEDVMIMTDRYRVEQVILNLLMNAARYTVEGSIALSYDVISENNRVTITVTDTGAGVPKGKEEAIFSRSERTAATLRGKLMGLYISRQIAKMLGGYLVLDDSYHNGAKFHFSIPIQ